DDVRGLADRAADVDILVNNAGVFPAGATHELSEAAFDQALRQDFAFDEELREFSTLRLAFERHDRQSTALPAVAGSRHAPCSSTARSFCAYCTAAAYVG